MRREDFQPGFPGELVATTFHEQLAGHSADQLSGLAFVPAELPPRLDRTQLLGRLYDALERAQASLLRLNGLVGSLPGQHAPLAGLLAALRTREAQASSRIENTFASVREVAVAAVDAKASTPDALDIHRNMHAIEVGLRSQYGMICVNLVREMHRTLIVQADKLPGGFRREQVCIGDEHRGFSQARFVPPPAERVDELMRGWERFCNPTQEARGRPEWLPYWVNLALAHYQFETIHPFRDGNGRLGRALVTIAPVKDGMLDHPVCNLSEWVYAHRQEYYDRLLRVSTHGEWEAWIRFFLTALAEQASADMDRAKKLVALHTSLRQKLVSPRASILQGKLLDYLFEGRGVTIAIAAKVMGISTTAARKHIEKFEALKIIRPIDDRTYDRIYVPEGVLKIIKGKGED